MKSSLLIFCPLIFVLLTILGCNTEDASSEDDTNLGDVTSENCTSDQVLDTSRGECEVSLEITPSFEETTTGTVRKISSNSIPNNPTL